MGKKNILILRDGRTGNFRQAQAVAGIVSRFLRARGFSYRIDIQEIEFKNKLAHAAAIAAAAVAGRFSGALPFLRMVLKGRVYKELSAYKPDVIVTGGSSVAPVNLLFSGATAARSIAVMRPTMVRLSLFDLLIMPRHDHPPVCHNVVVTDGALNLVDPGYLKEQGAKLLGSIGAGLAPERIGVLIGGDAKGFHLPAQAVAEVIAQAKSVAAALGADILISTSRRTSREVEDLVKREMQGDPRCKLCVIANEKNLTEAVGGMLDLCRFVVISPESIMMISEAVNSRKYVLVFGAAGLGERHRRFLGNFARNKYIYLTRPSRLGQVLSDLAARDPGVNTPARDVVAISGALAKFL